MMKYLKPSIITVLLLSVLVVVLASRHHQASSKPLTEQQCLAFQSETDDVMNAHRQNGDCSMLLEGLKHCTSIGKECDYCGRIIITVSVMKCGSK